MTIRLTNDSSSASDRAGSSGLGPSIRYHPANAIAKGLGGVDKIDKKATQRVLPVECQQDPLINKG